MYQSSADPPKTSFTKKDISCEGVVLSRRRVKGLFSLNNILTKVLYLQAQAGGFEGDGKSMSASETLSDAVEKVIADDDASQQYTESMLDSQEDAFDMMYQACIPLRFSRLCHSLTPDKCNLTLAIPVKQKAVVLQGALPYRQEPMIDRPLTGWVLAMSVLVAARLGRSAAEAQRFDLSHLQVATQLLCRTPHEQGVPLSFHP